MTAVKIVTIVTEVTVVIIVTIVTINNIGDSDYISNSNDNSYDSYVVTSLTLIEGYGGLWNTMEGHVVIEYTIYTLMVWS